ncbi:cation:proton antiporter [Peribacillus asahii]|uniref:cation:proton antiporter n=1 Tax=Peribacillus asahii TaxID=228899 RepID=UPI00207920C5|nr:cation:proton antiporter [Peribacillus asahii]USK68314.1 cation:proton antiporter [Peribacillus asahii]
MELYLQLFIIIIATKLAGVIAVRFGQPSVLGKLIIGVIIGPAVLDWVQNTEVIEALSHIGVLLLMFIAGLETDLKELNNNKKSSLSVAMGGIILPLIGGYLSGLAVGMDQHHAIFLGLLLCATSVSISVQTFKELGQLKSREGTTVLGAAIADDIIVVVALAFMMSFLVGGDVSIGAVIGKKVVFFAIIALLAWKVVPFMMSKLGRIKVTQPAMSIALGICFLFAYLAEYFGVAGIIGSFAAGIAIAQTDFKEEVEKKIEPVAYTLFVPVFFVSIGLTVTFDGFLDHIFIIIGLSLVAIFTKLIGAGMGARITGFDTRSSMTIGAGMISRGEVALILATLGLSENLLDPDYFTTIIIVVIVTTIVTPPLLKYFVNKQDSNKKAA